MIKWSTFSLRDAKCDLLRRRQSKRVGDLKVRAILNDDPNVVGVLVADPERRNLAWLFGKHLRCQRVKALECDWSGNPLE